MAKAYMVTYDLRAKGQKYEEVIQAIKDASLYWCTYWESSFLIKSNFTASEITNEIAPHLDSNDSLIVIEVNPANYQGWLETDQWTFINQKIFS